jgi:hypothetical protein
MSEKKGRSTKFTQTETRPYKSIYKEGYVTEANYITEVIFKKRSEKFDSGKLPENFWQSAKHKGAYTGQLIQASRLLKKYKGKSIIDAINCPRASYIFKLQDKKLVPLIEEFEKINIDKVIETTETVEYVKRVTPTFGKKNRLGGL